MTVEDTLVKARELIKTGQFEAAHALLATVDHPKATEWMTKLENMYGVAKKPSALVVRAPNLPALDGQTALPQLQLDEARELIKQKRYDEAHALLRTVSHPKASEWIAKLEQQFGVGKSANRLTPHTSSVPAATALSVTAHIVEQSFGDSPSTSLLAKHASSMPSQPALPFTAQKLDQARSLIENKRYDDAYAILLTLDDPVAMQWMQKLERMLNMVQQHRPVIPAPPSSPNVSTSSQVIVNTVNSGPGCLVQAIWYLLFGWWLGQISIILAWFAMLTVIGLPLGIWLISNIAVIVALRSRKNTPTVSVLTTTTVGDGSSAPLQSLIQVGGRPKQRHFLVRTVYFFLIGWWLSAFWMQLAYFLCGLIIGMPLGFWMFEKTPTLLTLRRD